MTDQPTPVLHKFLEEAANAHETAHIEATVGHVLESAGNSLKREFRSAIAHAYQQGLMDGFKQGCVAEAQSHKPR